MKENFVSPVVYGIETEYSCMVVMPNDEVYELVGACHEKDNHLGLYEPPKERGTQFLFEDRGLIDEALLTMDIVRTTSGLLSNGGRFYIDPSGPEYATPETTTATEAVQRMFDGDTIVHRMFHHLRESGHINAFQLNRRIIDHNRVSRGIHINTSTTMPADEFTNKEYYPADLNRIASVNVCKGALFGSGGLLLDDEGNTQFHHSPRLSVTTDLMVHYSSHAKRPLIRVPFKSDFENLNRIETVTSDALNFAWPMRASMVVTNALFTLIELGKLHRLPRLRDPVEDALVVGQVGHQALLTAVNSKGEDYSRQPQDVIRELCDIALEVDKTEHVFDEESLQVLPEVIEIAETISRDLGAVSRQVESVAREAAMLHLMKEKACTYDSETMCRFDYKWDLIGGGTAERLREKGSVGWLGQGQDDSVRAKERRLVTPPQNTRAKQRADYIRSTEGQSDLNWEQQYFEATDKLNEVPPR